MTYQDASLRFLYEAVPSPSAGVSAAVRFEAVAAEVWGTKQRRFGPMPSPEEQTAVRDVLRAGGAIQFFAPWGSSKQDGRPLDVLEFMALRQLACVRDGLARLGRDAEFSFRVEDLTDRYLLPGGESRQLQIEAYALSFAKLAAVILPGSRVVLESQLVRWADFKATADDFRPVFFNYLNGNRNSGLADIGWTGTIPPEQLAYYTAAYKVFYPGENPLWHAAGYFAATLARVKLSATAVPTAEGPGTNPIPFLTAAFTHPVPGNPVNRPRVHYRTLADRYTHQHKSPWLASGYLEIGDDGSVRPRFIGPETGELVPQTLRFAGVDVEAPFLPK